MRTRSDKQNKRFLRNSRSASSLKDEIKETKSSSIRRALNRTNRAALIANLKSDSINFKLARILTNALLDLNASKLTKGEVQIVKRFDELMHMNLKQARISKLVPTRGDVVILFRVLKKANPSKANSLSQTFKFRKIN